LIVTHKYVQSVTSYDELIPRIDEIMCANTVFIYNKEEEKTAWSIVGLDRVIQCADFQQGRAVKRYMSKTEYSFLPVTQLQALLINSVVFRHKDPDLYLSPG
jgi:hypothetical protein